MVEGRDVPVQVSARIDEVSRLEAAFREAHDAIRQRQDLVKREKAALEREKKTLQESENRLSAFLTHSATSGWLKDEEGRYVYISPSCERLLNTRLEDWRGKTDFEIFARETAEEFRRNDQAVLASDGSIEVIERMAMPDGSETWWLNSKFAFRDAEGRRYVGGLGVDITARMRAEEAVREKEAERELLLNATPFMLTRCSRDLRYRYVSRAYAAMLGRRPEEIAGKPILEITGPDGFAAIRPHVEKVLQGERVEYEAPVSFVGVPARELHVVYVPDYDERKNVTGWMAAD